MNDNILSLDPKSLSQPDLHNYLLTSIAPRPIALASTIDSNGNVNLSPFSFFNVFSSNPPILIISPARSGRDNTTKHTYQNVKDVGEVVINIVNYPIVEQMSLSSTAYAKGVNEFDKAGFTQVKSIHISPPRVGESPVSLECRVRSIDELGSQGGAGNLIICEVVMVHINQEYITHGKLDTTKLDLVGRMGESWYVRATGEALFEIPKPLRTQGIGIDNLPLPIRESTFLTGNQLARMGNVEATPTQEQIDKVRPLLITNTDKDIHQLIGSYLDKDEVSTALALAFTQV